MSELFRIRYTPMDVPIGAGELHFRHQEPLLVVSFRSCFLEPLRHLHQELVNKHYNML